MPDKKTEHFPVLKRVVLVLGIIAVLIATIITAATLYFLRTNPPGSTSSRLFDPASGATLRDIGIDSNELPAEFSQAQADCAVAAVGEQRAKEILGGAAPTIGELMKAKSCLQAQ